MPVNAWVMYKRLAELRNFLTQLETLVSRTRCYATVNCALRKLSTGFKAVSSYLLGDLLGFHDGLWKNAPEKTYHVAERKSDLDLTRGLRRKHFGITQPIGMKLVVYKRRSCAGSSVLELLG